MRFNLVIEMLFFSSIRAQRRAVGDQPFKFQSRNRDAFLFKDGSPCDRARRSDQFQSRNRDAFLFKFKVAALGLGLFIQFQSRNRDAFLFKCVGTGGPHIELNSFNLVIEMLFFSRVKRPRLPADRFQQVSIS